MRERPAVIREIDAELNQRVAAAAARAGFV
jgi:hypothetical protein